ncbi:MAG: hypothetical protein JNK60_02750 [Acidobacteria bacterium]|nr:hypothetical protein [Acidobacteriota bacterium]
MDTRTQNPRPRPASASPELSSDDITAVVQEASRLHGQEIKQQGAPSLTRVEDAFALAEELGIPEEHVRAALARRQEQKSIAAGGFARPLLFGAAGGLGTAVLLTLAGSPLLVTVLVAAVVAGGIFGIAALVDLMKRNPQKSEGPAPVPGTCRVCFRPAHTPQSTFCEEHRYKA